MSDGSSRTLVYGLFRISQRQFVASTSTTLTSFYVYDGHGSTRALTDATGAVTDTYDYDAWGNLLHSTGTTENEFLYASEQYDADLHLYYNRSRYLNTVTGRFWTMDTYEGDPQSPQSLHKYLYVGANPVNMLDPSGHDGLMELLTTFAIQQALNFIVDFTFRNVLTVFISALIPKGTYQDILTFFPDATVIGGTAGAQIAKGSIGLGFNAGIELVFSLRTFRSAVFTYFGVGLSFASSNGSSASAAGYIGVAYRCRNSGDYAGPGFTLSFSVGLLPPKVGTKVFQDAANWIHAKAALPSLPSVFANALSKTANHTGAIANATFNLGVSYSEPHTTTAAFSQPVSTQINGSTSSANSFSFGAVMYYQLFPWDGSEVPFVR